LSKCDELLAKLSAEYRFILDYDMINM